MVLVKLTLTCSEADARVAEQRLLESDMLAASAVSRFEQGPAAWLVEAYFERSPEPRLIEAALAGLVPTGMSIEPVPDRNWIAHVEAILSPVAAGCFLVHGPHDRHRAVSHPHAIEIEAGEAFGTAHHATTQGCLEALSGILGDDRPRRVLDIGTGSGILAIGCAQFPACAPILATDIDPRAVAIARENADKNAVGARIEVIEAAGLDHPRLATENAFDLILANILAGPLIGLARGIARILAPGGHVILSGLLEDQAGSVRSAYEDAGLQLVTTIERPGWPTLVMARV